MNDFSLINANVNWNLGPKLEVTDNFNSVYAMNFFRISDNVKHSIHEKCEFLPFSWYRSNLTFRIMWQVQVWGWKDKPTVLFQETYNEKNKNICLHFVNDTYSSQYNWLLMSDKLSRDNDFNLHIISKFSDRLKNQSQKNNIIFHNNTYDYDKLINENNIYATYVIDRKEIVTRSANWWETETIYLNHYKSAKSWNHPNDWFDLNDEDLFKNLMSI